MNSGWTLIFFASLFLILGTVPAYAEENGTAPEGEEFLRQSGCEQNSCQSLCKRGQVGKCSGSQCYCYAGFGDACGSGVTPGCGACDSSDDVCKTSRCSCRSCKSCNFQTKYATEAECKQNCYCSPKGSNTDLYFFSSNPKNVVCQHPSRSTSWQCLPCRYEFYNTEAECEAGGACSKAPCRDTGHTCSPDAQYPDYFTCSKAPVVANPEL